LILSDEERHLSKGPRPDERPGGAGTATVVAQAQGDAAEVLARAREVMGEVVKAGEPWPDLDYWRSRLPGWFVESFALERSREEIEQGWRGGDRYHRRSRPRPTPSRSGPSPTGCSPSSPPNASGSGGVPQWKVPIRSASSWKSLETRLRSGHSSGCCGQRAPPTSPNRNEVRT
jgi:hypothetical protein